MKPDSVSRLTGLLLGLSTLSALADSEGLLDISGSLNHAPCVLEMTSAYQTVDLKTVPRSVLMRPGDGATPQAFQLRFLDCRRASGSVLNDRTGTLVWSAYQPVVSVSFVAVADADDPRLVKVQGVSGMGLRLTDSLGRDVRLGSRGAPLFLAHGSDTLTWHVQPTRTSAALTNGAFRAAVDFRLNYE
ncbi:MULTISPECIES: fimbrial protein [unclassified Pseudomonas]|uniref:fimbrial protein n=1 Tax=unclassified Pseudomonas TaxID=196821 RepID=UPI0028D6E955|nr:fimbrial protein [uncultured Pseudomonas sp.]